MAKRETAYKAPNGLSPAERAAYEKAASKPRGGYWPPLDVKPGDSYVGNLVAVEDVESTFTEDGKKGGKKKMQRLYTFKNEDTITKVYGATVLDSEFDSVEAKQGDRLLILCQGRAEKGGKGKQPAKLFSVVKVETGKAKR